MRITVYYKNGRHQAFIVPRDILAADFRLVAEAVGGRIQKLVFTHMSDIDSFKHRVHQ